MRGAASASRIRMAKPGPDLWHSAPDHMSSILVGAFPLPHDLCAMHSIAGSHAVQLRCTYGARSVLVSVLMSAWALRCTSLLCTLSEYSDIIEDGVRCLEGADALTRWMIQYGSGMNRCGMLIRSRTGKWPPLHFDQCRH
jgi:hypothetical protein